MLDILKQLKDKAKELYDKIEPGVAKELGALVHDLAAVFEHKAAQAAGAIIAKELPKLLTLAENTEEAVNAESKAAPGEQKDPDVVG